MKWIETLTDWCSLTWSLGWRRRWRHDRLGFSLTVRQQRQQAALLPVLTRQQHRLEMIRIVLECERLIDLGAVDSVAAEIAGSPLEAVLLQRLWSALRQLGQ